MARVLLGISGGIAAYKAASVLRLLVTAGHDVRVVATANAQRFIGKTTFEALSRNPVETELFEDVAAVRHVELAKWAELVVVAPATAAFLARYANGLADDLLTNVLLATKAGVLVAPAMHTEMWEHASTRANLSTLAARGVGVVEPVAGPLTGGDSGVGRLAEPEAIFGAVQAALAAAGALVAAGEDSGGTAGEGLTDPANTLRLAGRSVLITAGGTREPIDAVRFIGNRSSGRQGIALAKAALARGASVTLIAANLEPGFGTDLAGLDSSRLDVVRVATAEELTTQLLRLAPGFDLVICAAAVADYRPAVVEERKIKKSEQGAELSLRLVQTADALALVVGQRNPEQIVVGFAAETATDRAELLVLARGKLAAKGCHFLVANDVTAGRVFDSASNEVLVVSPDGLVAEAAGSKEAVAQAILDAITHSLA